MRFKAFSIIGLVGASFVLGGCRSGGGGGGGNTNDNVTSNGLTDDQKAAIESALGNLEALASTLAGSSTVSEPPDGDGTFGECPEVTGVVEDDVVQITLDFGDACTNGEYGGAALSGTISGTVERATRAVTLVYDGFSVDDQQVDGAITFDRTADPADGNSFTMTVTLVLAGIGTIDGDLTARFNTIDATITVSEASLTLAAEDGSTIEVAAEGLVYAPIDNGNFIPEAGTLTLVAPNDNPPPDTFTIVIEFDEESPADGTVDVTVGNAPTVEYQLEDGV